MKKYIHSIRFKILVLILVIIIPCVLLVIYSSIRERKVMLEIAKEQMSEVVSSIVTQQELLDKATEQFLRGISEIYTEFGSKDKKACSRILGSLIKQSKIYANIGIALPDGNVWCSGLPLEKTVNFSDRRWFQDVLRTKDFLSSVYVFGRITSKPLSVYGYPVLDNSNNVKAVVFAGIDITWLNEYVKGLSYPDAVITIIDKHGNILARTHEPERWVGKKYSDSEIINIISKTDGKGKAEAVGIDGIKRIYAFAPLRSYIKETGYVLAGIPSEKIYAPANRMLYNNLILLAIATFLSLTAGYFIGDTAIVKRLNALINATERMKEGDLGARTGLKYGKSEISNLAKAFDEMAEKLQTIDREKEDTLLKLYESEQRLLHLLSVSPVIIYTLEPDTFRLIWVSPNINEIIGYTVSEALKPEWWLENINPEDRERAKEMSSRVLTEGTIVHEYRFRKKDGEFIWVRDEMKAIKDKGGNPLTIIGAWADITKSKQAEEKIIEQLQTINALYAGAQRIAISLDPDEVAYDIAKTCVEQFNVDLAWVGIAEEDGSVALLSQSPEEHPYPRQIKVRWDDTPEGNGPTGKAIKTSLPVKFDNLTEDPHFSSWRDLAKTYGFICSLAIPLISRGKTIGSLNLYSKTKGFFTQERIETFQTFANQAATSIENARLFDEAKRRLSAIEALRNIDMAITSSLDPRVTLHILVDEVINQLNVDAASVLLTDPVKQVLYYSTGRGFKTKLIESTNIRLGEGVIGQAIKEQKAIRCEIYKDDIDPSRSQILKEEGFNLYYMAPMISKGKVLGILETFYREPRKNNKEWVELLKALAGQAAIAIENSQLFYNVEKSNIELQRAYDETIKGWSRAMDFRDKETEGHTQRVTELTIKIARYMGINEEEIVYIRRGALLHDMGKLGVPDHILLKPGKLTDEEMSLMKTHPQLAYEMLSPIEYLRRAIDIPYCHHEKWDGTGYPRGLKGKQIPLSARIFAIVDVWDALRSDRPYRPAWSKEEALNYIKEESGKSFDPEIVDIFLKMIE
jgi:PAS domain S-box-containing protein